MFSVQQKRDISEAVQKVLRATGHPELPEGEIPFNLHVDGAQSWSWADIRNNGAVAEPSVNPQNERQDPACACFPRGGRGDHRWDCPANPNRSDRASPAKES